MREVASKKRVGCGREEGKSCGRQKCSSLVCFFSVALQCLLVISDIRGTVAATDPRSWDVLMPDALDPNPK